MERGAWRATDHSVAKSWTGLSSWKIMVLKRSVELAYDEPHPNPAGASIFSLARGSLQQVGLASGTTIWAADVHEVE